MTPSSRIEAHNSLLPLPESSHAFSNITFACPLPITPKLMDKLNELIKKSRLTFGFSVPTILQIRPASLPQLNSFTTQYPTAHLRLLLSPSSSDMNLAPICHSAKPFCQSWKIASLPWKLPERKPSLLMKLPVGLCLNAPMGSFPLGKSATRCG